MTEMQERTHYYVAFEHFQLFLAFCSANRLKNDQTTLIRKPGSASKIPHGSTIHVLDKPDQDVLVELDMARLTRECAIKYISPFDKPVERERRHA